MDDKAAFFPSSFLAKAVDGNSIFFKTFVLKHYIKAEYYYYYGIVLGLLVSCYIDDWRVVLTCMTGKMGYKTYIEEICCTAQVSD